MTNDVAAQITALSADDLTPVIHRTVGADAVVKGDVQAAKIGRGIGMATAGIYRVTGRAQTNDGEQPWSAVVKALGVPETKRAWLQDDGFPNKSMHALGPNPAVGPCAEPRCNRIAKHHKTKVSMQSSKV